MNAEGSFPRPTATVGTLLPWATELARTAGGLVRSYLPGAPIDPRTRERLILSVTEINGCRYSAWVHGTWSEFLGGVDADDGEDALLDYARACAAAGHPLDPGPLGAVLPSAALSSLRATVACVEVENLLANTAGGLIDRIRRRRPLDPRSTAREALTLALVGPLAGPVLALTGTMRVANRLVPPLPPLEVPPDGEANLLVHLLAGAAPGYLRGTVKRAILSGLPVSIPIAVRSGRSAATIRFGRGRVSIENDVRGDAWLVIDGDVARLLDLASSAILREVRSVRAHPG